MRPLLWALAIFSFSIFIEPSAKLAPKHPPERLASATLIHRVGKNAALLNQVGQTPASEIDFNWSFTPTLPACTTVLKSCYEGFTLTLVNTGTVVATPSALGPAALSYQWVPPGGVPYGALTFTLVTNGYDASGDPTISVPTSVTIKNDVTSLAPPVVGVPVP
jgi:hypothetical protein